MHGALPRASSRQRITLGQVACHDPEMGWAKCKQQSVQRHLAMWEAFDLRAAPPDVLKHGLGAQGRSLGASTVTKHRQSRATKLE